MEQYELAVGDDYTDENGVIRTSLVDNPATQKLFAVFNEEKIDTVNEKFKVILPTRENEQRLSPNKDDKFERIISGVWFMPDTDYPRLIKDENGDDKMITTSMSKDELMLAVKHFTQSNRQNEFDIMHNGIRVEGLTTMEIWMMYDHNQLSPILLNSIEDLGYKPQDIPLGTVFMTVFIENEEFFNTYILSGLVKGFSIEGLFDYYIKESEPNKEEMTEELTKSEELFSSLGIKQKFGTLIVDNDDTLSINEEIKLNDELITEGSFKTKSNFSLEIREGKVVDFGFENQDNVDDSTVQEVKTNIDNVTEESNDVVEDTNAESNDDTSDDTSDDNDTKEVEVKPVVVEDKSNEYLKEIEDLKAKLEVERLAKEELIKAQPIKKAKATNVPSNVEAYTTKTVGGKTFYIPKV